MANNQSRLHPERGEITNINISNRLETIPAAIVVVTPDAKVVYWNGRGSALFGYDAADAIGRLLCEIIVPPSGLGEEQKFFRATLESGSGELECVRQRKNGSLVFVYISSKVLRDAQGKIEFVLSSIKDMTRVKFLSDASAVAPDLGDQTHLLLADGLRQSQEQFRLLVEGVQDHASFMLSSAGKIVSWNVGAERISGYKAKEIIGGDFSCFYPSEVVELGSPEWELRTAIEQGHSEDEGWRLRKGGERFWANVVITALFDEHGSLTGFAQITRDLTQQKNAEAMQYKNIQLQNAAEAKSRFLANMSHELRTPLNGIIGFAEFLVDGKPGALNSKQKEYLGDILKSGRYLLQLVSDVLDLAKAGAGKMELNPVRFSLSKAIPEVCALTKPTARKKGIRIDVNVAPELDEVTLDQQKFKQVLYNVLSNAIKFNRDGGKVEIRAEPYEEDRVKIVITDTGIGIQAEDVERIFKEFEQLELSTSRRHEGTGLGLALTRKIVELQGGTISVASEFGKGSSFIIVLPLVTAGG
jgi:PAS domain S-box-containing protein